MVPKFAVGYIINDSVNNRPPIRVSRQEHELRTLINKSGDKPGASHPIDLYFFARDPFHGSISFHPVTLRLHTPGLLRLQSLAFEPPGRDAQALEQKGSCARPSPSECERCLDS